MRPCLCAVTAPDRAYTGTGVRRQRLARVVEEAVSAASKTGFRCLELSLDAVQDYLAIYSLVVLDRYL